MRQFINVSWNNSSTVYDGSQQMNHFRKNGSAAIEAYGDPEPVKKVKKVKAPDFRSSVERSEDRLDARRVVFEKAFEEGKIDFDRYNMLLTEWEASRAKLDKKMGLVKDEDVSNEPTPFAKTPMINHIEDCAKSFAARHPFAFLVTSIMVGAGILNVFGFGG